MYHCNACMINIAMLTLSHSQKGVVFDRGNDKGMFKIIIFGEVGCLTYMYKNSKHVTELKIVTT